MYVHGLIFLSVFSVEGSGKEEEPSELSLQTCVLHAMGNTGTVEDKQNHSLNPCYLSYVISLHMLRQSSDIGRSPAHALWHGVCSEQYAWLPCWLNILTTSSGSPTHSASTLCIP